MFVRALEGTVLVPVPGVTVSCAGRRALTGASGRTVLPVRLTRAGRYRLIASRAGCHRAVKRLRVSRR